MNSSDYFRFMEKVDVTETCWLWTGCCDFGYGKFWLNGKNHKAHRLMLEEKLGRPIADGMDAAHAPIICHNRACVNPEHLREATRAENVADTILDNTRNIGEQRPDAKLTEADISIIRADMRSHSDIAKDYGVSKTTIGYVKRRVTWSHIT